MVQNYRPFNSILTPTDGDAAYNTSAELAAIVQAATVNGAFVKLWQKTIPAQTGYRWGHGSPAFQFNQGLITFAAVDVGTINVFADGNLEFRLSNAAGTTIVIQARMFTGQLHAGTRVVNATAASALLIDRQQAPPFPEQGDFVYEDSRLELWFQKIVAGGTIDAVDFRIPATVYSA